MKAKLTRIHIGIGMPEIGVQFEFSDGAGGAVTQRAFVSVDAASLAPVWAAAQQALASAMDTLPLDLPPGNVTSALMKQRAAEAAARIAHNDHEDIRKAMAATMAQHATLDAELAAKKAEAAKLTDHLTMMRAAVASAQTTE